MSEPWLCTREDVATALDFMEVSRNRVQIDRAIAAASRTVEGLCMRRFYPEIATRLFDWPNDQHAPAYRLWLDANELISVSSLTSGGTAIGPTQYFLQPMDGPPYTHIDLDQSTAAAWTVGNTSQRSISITGTFGYRNHWLPAGVTAEALDDSETLVDVSDSAAIGIGQIIKVGSEMMLVTDRITYDSGDTLQGDMTASAADQILAVTDGTAWSINEVVTCEAEKMFVLDITGNNLIVKRAWDGSTLAAHTGVGLKLYVPRTLIVERGALGSTAAAHAGIGTAITKFNPPALVHQLAVAEAISELLQESAGYARVVGGPENAYEARGVGLTDLRARCCEAHARKARARAV